MEVQQNVTQPRAGLSRLFLVPGKQFFLSSLVPYGKRYLRYPWLPSLMFFILMMFVLSSCQVAQKQETRVEIKKINRNIPPLYNWSQTPLKISKETVVVDGRSAFEYALSHIRGAIRLDASHFDLHLPKGRSEKQAAKEVARRLALKGIGPKSHVVIYGKGKRGKGEEGLLAWTLYYLGVEKVHFAADSHFGDLSWSNEESSKSKNVPYWEPKAKKHLKLNTETFKQLLGRAGEYRKNRKSKDFDERFRVIDVRSENEFLGRTGMGRVLKAPDFGAINIAWTEFFTHRGKVNSKILEDLKSLKINEKTRIIVISENGIRAAAVSMALIALGYRDIALLEGGLRSYLKMSPERL